MGARRSASSRVLAVLAVLVGLCAPGSLEARQTVPARAPRVEQRVPGWIGLSFVTTHALPGAAGGPGSVIVVSNVHPDSPAFRAGLQPGDTIVRVDGRVAGPETLARLQESLVPGRRVALAVRRAGRLRTIPVEAGRRPADETLFTVAPQILVRLDSAEAEFLRHLETAWTRGAERSPGVAQRTFAGTAPPEGMRLTIGDSARFAFMPDGVHFSLGSDSARVFVWRRFEPPVAPTPFQPPEPPLPQSAPMQAVLLEMQSRAHEFELATARAALAGRVVETSRALEEARRALVVAGSSQAESAARASLEAALEATQNIHRRPLAPYILGQDWVAGARLTALNPGLGEYFGTDRGLLVVEVAPGTPAAGAGIAPGDVILAAGQRDVASLEELRGAVAGVGTAPLPITVLRKGARVRVALPRE